MSRYFKSVSLPLRSAAGALRVRDWASCKLSFLIVCIGYAALQSPVIGQAELWGIAVLFVLFFLLAGFGYAVNSFADIEDDVRAGKANAFSQMTSTGSRATIALITISSIVGGLVAVFWFGSASLAILLAANFVLAALYSLPPVRCKERGILGVAVSAVAQRTLPALIVFEAFGVTDLTAVGLVILNTVVGVRYILVHQIKDYVADIHADVHTLTTQLGVAATEHSLRRVVFPVEMITLAGVVALMINREPSLIIAVGAFAILAAPQIISGVKKPIPERTYAALCGFYYLYWPVALAVILALRNEGLWPLVLVVVLWSARRLEREIRVLVRAIIGGPKRRDRTAASEG